MLLVQRSVDVPLSIGMPNPLDIQKMQTVMTE